MLLLKPDVFLEKGGSFLQAAVQKSTIEREEGYG
jgi:hypothetical protein